MLEGYTQEKFGLIKMTDPPKCNYGKEYQAKLLGRGEMNRHMAYLRYGYMVGIIERPPFRILDVGYGDGEFLRVCAESHYTAAYGMELNMDNLPDGCKFASDPTAQMYDVVSFFDSLEHFESLDFLGKLQCNYVYVSCPNCEYHSDAWFREWKHRKPEEHIWHFNLSSITTLFAYHGYERVAVSYIENIIRKCQQDILTVMFKKR